MSDFFRGKKCSICGKDATCAHFGKFLCGSDDCMANARESRECAGKTMKPGPVSGNELMKK